MTFVFFITCYPLDEVMMMSNEEKSLNKEEKNMNASAVKPTGLFVTSKKLERTPASQENIDRIKFMDSHNFSLDIDENKKVNIKVSKKP